MMCFSDKLFDSITRNLSPKLYLLNIINLRDFKNILERSVSVNTRYYLKGS
jgi:hypothetical protein